MSRRLLMLIAIVAFAAAIAGVFVGRALWPAPRTGEPELMALLRDDLNLDTAQRARMAEIEQRFGTRRRALEQALRADNARLAAAIQEEQRTGPRVQAAVDASHRSMGKLQKETLTHIFEMRKVLRPDQASAFDRAVAKALTDDGQ